MSDLSLVQLKFLATYLHVVPNPKIFKGKKKKEIDYNNRVTAEYEAYLEKKAEADALLAEIAASLETSRQLQRSSPKDGLTDAAKLFFDRVSRAGKEYDAYNRECVQINVTVVSADANNPGFVTGRNALDILIFNLNQLKKRVPDTPPSLQSGAVGVLFARKRDIGALSQFKSAGMLNDKVVKMPLPDDGEDQKRINLLKQHGDACKSAMTQLDDLLTEAKKPENAGNSAIYVDRSDTIVSDLRNDLGGIEKDLLAVIGGSAREKLSELVTGNDDIAKREVERLNIITDNTARLDTLLTALKDKANELKDAHANAETPSAKREAAKEYRDVKERMEQLETRKSQLKAYEDQLVLRTAKIDEARSELLVWSDDPAQAMQDNMPNPLTDLSRDPSEILILGGKDKNDPTKMLPGQIDNLRAQYDNERHRLRLDAKLFPNESDLTYLNETQHVTLMAMLDEAEKFARAGALDKAQYAIDRTVALHAKIDNAARSALPEPVAKVPSDEEKIARRLTELSVKLDRFWGLGGDAGNALRTLLNRVHGVYDKELAKDAPLRDFTRIGEAVDAYEKKLNAEISAFKPQVGDMLTRDKAKDARNKLIGGLLDIYNTKELQESQLDSVPEDKLLILEKDGTTHYYEIQTKHDGTVDRRGDHKIPREAMENLLQQANMLEMLAKSSAPDCIEAINEATAKAEADFAAISAGSEDYEHVRKTVIKCDTLIADKLFATWIPDGFFETRTKFDSFKDSYKRDLLPAEAKRRVDVFHTDLTNHKTNAEKLKKDFEEVEKLVEQVESTLRNGRRGDKPNLVQKLQEIVDGAPGSLQGTYVAAPEDTAELAPLIAEMKTNLDKISPALKKDGLEGLFKDRIKTARTKLETKSGTGIGRARTDVTKIKQDMQDKLTELGTLDSMAAIKKLAAFLKTEGAGQDKITTAQTAFGADTKTIEDDLDAVKKILKDSKRTLATYEEYMDVEKALKSQLDVLKKNKDPVDAADQLRQLKVQAAQLKEEVSNLSNIAAGKGEGVDFAKWESALKSKFADVSKEAATVAAEIRKKAAETTVEPQDGIDQTEADRQTTEIRDAAEAAAKTLDLITTGNFDQILTLDASLPQEATNALRITDDAAARKAALATVREKALAEIRRIRQQIDSHPALGVYRNNPFSIKSWAPFLGAMHSFDVMVLTKLKPV
ncbi:hypothetical protein GI582_01400 [Sulfitobacter sp. BDSS02]|nr:hypothetical protein [Sulfitobacter sp. BDSS02]MBR9848001.1 hypothetical protein [Paracoccaceae bacterium]